MTIPMIEKIRIPLSRVFSAALILLILSSESVWEGIVVAWILFACSCFLVGIASIGRLWCSLYIAGYKTDFLVTEGPYSMCRHPLYFFSFLGAIGVGLSTETMLIPLIIAIGFSLYYPYAMKSEESDLSERHGNAYQVYRNTTPAFFPKLSQLREPETYKVYPKIFRKHIFDDLWFIWLVGIIEIIEGLHELHIIPAVIKLY